MNINKQFQFQHLPSLVSLTVFYVFQYLYIPGMYHIQFSVEWDGILLKSLRNEGRGLV